MGDLVAATPGRYGPAVVWLLRFSTSDHTDVIVQAACTSGDMPDSVGLARPEAASASCLRSRRP